MERVSGWAVGRLQAYGEVTPKHERSGHRNVKLLCLSSPALKNDPLSD